MDKPKQKTIVTITGIRPDFIRMSEIFKKLDENFNHILIHTGQHFDKLLSDVFFDELDIRKPNFNLEIGGNNKEHFHQTGDLSIKIIELLRYENIKPDLLLFLGDSNSVSSSVSLKKEGYKIGHIEAGMRSYDKRMLEEINRIVCDHCSDFHFVYHENYKQKLILENLPNENIFVVGNTLVEVYNKFSNNIINNEPTHILLDIHRPENFNYENRLKNIINYANIVSEYFNIEIKLLNFKRTLNKIKEYNINLGNIQIVELMSYKEFLQFQNDSLFIISDSGSAQEEPALLNKKVITPRNYTERPESVDNNCSFMLNVDDKNTNWEESIKWIGNSNVIKTEWLGKGNTSELIIKILKERL